MIREFRPSRILLTASLHGTKVWAFNKFTMTPFNRLPAQ